MNQRPDLGKVNQVLGQLTPPQSPVDKIKSVLNLHQNKNFVKRILTPEAYPSLANKDGTTSTHSMAWGDDGKGHYYVYPTVVQRAGKLERLGDDEAFNYAQKTGEYIPFANKYDADWFSQNYKQLWGHPPVPIK